MKISPKVWRIGAVLGVAAVGLVIAGCISLGVTFEWKSPALQFSHTSFSTPLNDSAADIVRYVDKSYIVFQGYDNVSANTQIYLRVADQFATHQISATQLTSDNVDNTQPHITFSRGYLYVVYRHYGGNLLFVPNYNIYWMKIRVSDLAIVAGPTLVSTSTDADGKDDINPQIVHTAEGTLGSNSRTDIVWESPSILGTAGYTHTIMWNYVEDNGTVGTPKLVSAGTGCPGTVYHQFAPRITRSSGGTQSYVVWYGRNSASTNRAVYWRAVYNSLPGFATNCINVSSGDADDKFNPRISTNSNNLSFVAYTRLFGGTDNDVILRPVESNGTVCPRVIDLAASTADDRNPDVVAGDVVSSWVHLAWNHPVSNSGSFKNEVWYNVYDASNCISAPASVNTAGDSNGNITVTVSPFPSSASAGAPLIAVATGADILNPALANSISPESLQAQVSRLVENGTLSQGEADALLADGRITNDEVQSLLEAHVARAKARPQQVEQLKPGDSNPALARADGHHPLDADAQAFAQMCAVAPDNEDCQAAGYKVQPGAPGSPASPSANCGGINAQDAVALAWDDDQSPDVEWANEGVATSYFFGNCQTGMLADNGPVVLHRRDEAQDDDPPSRVLVTNHGVAHVVWPGFALHAGFLNFADDYDIFYAVTHIPLHLPIVLKNY